MANEHVKLSLKAWVHKENKKVIFAESNEDFIDILFSFLTMPVGTIIRLIRKQPTTIEIGCMNNLYESVEKFDVRLFRTEACKNMLLYPRNGAADQCKKLKWNIDDTGPLKYFIASGEVCGHLSHYKNAICDCGKQMELEKSLSKNENVNDHDRGVFVKELTQLMISDELQVEPPSTEAVRPLFDKLGLKDVSTTGESVLPIESDEVLTLLKVSLVSQTPLSETFLKLSPAPKLDQGSEYKLLEEPATSVDVQILVKLIVYKSKNVVLYAEASQDFVDLLFSFLTVPLGFIGKKMHSSSSKGCLKHLYNSIKKLDQFVMSEKHKTMLVSPKLAPNFRYENHPLGIEEDKHPTYYNTSSGNKLISDEELPSPDKGKNLIVTDPKSSSKEDTKGGFVRGPKKFTVTDNLCIQRISPIAGLSLLKKLNLSFDDIDVQDFTVGCEEALRLLVASFVSGSALTNAFLRKANP